MGLKVGDINNGNLTPMQHPHIKPSFFDDPLTAEYTMWKKGAPKKGSENKIIEGILFQKCPRTNFWKSRYYVLFEDRLACYKNGRESKEKSHCLIQNMRIEKIYIQNEKDENFGLRLMHNKSHFEIYARSKDVQEKWLAALAKFCVLTFYSSWFVNIKVIGKGSFAKVFLARRKKDGMNVAVKTFDKNLLLSVDKAKASLLNEINIMRKLEHENVISLYEVFESETHVYLVVELLNGGELFEKISTKGQYNERDASNLMRRLLSALAYMHSKGIMHRDIKPENLILKDNQCDWDVKIADFGLSTPINGGEQLFRRCGTPGYVAPEILADEKYDEKVDVFSAGVILYILLTGGSPFYAESYEQILLKNQNCDINYNFWQFGQQISEPAIDLLMRMLAKDPQERISAAEALSHPWILSEGMFLAPAFPFYLNYAQDNMQRFSQDHQFHMMNIKANIQDPSALERSLHAPSPLINGRTVTVADYRNQCYLNSPDFIKTGSTDIKNINQFNSSSQENVSLASTNGDSPNHEMLSEEMSFANFNLSEYNDEQTLLSQFNNGKNSNNSSARNTPMAAKKHFQHRKKSKKAIHVQETLLKYLSTHVQKQNEYEQKSSTVYTNMHTELHQINY